MIRWAQRRAARGAYYWTAGVALMGQQHITF